MIKKKLANWGQFPTRYVNEVTPNSYRELEGFVKEQDGLIPRGLGRCYGDASLGRNVISTTKLNQILRFDETKGIVITQAGVSIDDLLKLIVPKGYFIPVTPGTKYVTIGGALASDIHGKNHHVDGLFSNHVLWFKLMKENGSIVLVEHGTPLFNQTAGSLGRTGIILEICFQLKKIETSYIKQTAIRAKNLREVFELFELHQNSTYSVAWIDCLSKEKNIGRSVLLLGEVAQQQEIKVNKRYKVHTNPKFNIPFNFPSWFLSPVFIKFFNALYYHKPSSKSQAIVHYDKYFYPLDIVNNWNRIYGKNGFVQYQFVLPKEQSYQGIKKIVEILAKNNLGSFLAVLKLFGKQNPAYYQFPIEGYTLALDIKVSPKMDKVLDQLDDYITSLGGRIYLTKDARLKNHNFERQYPDQIHINTKFISYQMERLNRKEEHVFLVLGANSDIAKAVIRQYFTKFPKGHVILASRDTQALKSFAAGAGFDGNCTILPFDSEDLSSHASFVENLPHKPNWILYAAGILVTNEECINDNNLWHKSVTINFTGAVSIINELIKEDNIFLERIFGMSSIAALRGRKSNYAYGSAKSGFHQYLYGLSQYLPDRGVYVNAITPGVVDTKMTAHISDKGKASSPEEVANALFKAKKSRFVVYPNLFWKVIAFVVKIAPTWLIKKL